jgi:hypothetical protein
MVFHHKKSQGITGNFPNILDPNIPIGSIHSIQNRLGEEESEGIHFEYPAGIDT